MNKATHSMSDDDFMAELLGVKPKDIVGRNVDVGTQLRRQLSQSKRPVSPAPKGEGSEHIRSSLESNSRG